VKLFCAMIERDFQRMVTVVVLGKPLPVGANEQSQHLP